MAEMDAIKKQLNADDLMSLPDNGKRYELIEGELVEMSPTSNEHGFIELNVAYLIRTYLKQNPTGRAGVGEVGFRTRKDDKTVRAADAYFISYERLPKGSSTQGFSDIAPEVVIEVISPSDRTGDIADKTQEWLDFGVLMVWNIYPRQKSIHIFQPDQKPLVLFEDDRVDGGKILPDFSMKVSELFED